MKKKLWFRVDKPWSNIKKDKLLKTYEEKTKKYEEKKKMPKMGCTKF